MDFMLLPAHRGTSPTEVPKTPFVCGEERYDGGPFMSYPTRIGQPITAWNGSSFDFAEYSYETTNVNPLNIKKHESFLQTWLYFGLLAEFLGINESVEGDETGSKDQLDQLYESILLRKDGNTYVALELETLESWLDIVRSRSSPDPEIRKNRYQHLILCLTYTHPVLTSVPKEFNHAIKCSIAALGELLNNTVNFGLEHLGIKSTFGRVWAQDFLTQETRNLMKKNGWCPSDISRTESKYFTVQTLFIASMLDRSLPKRDHSGCNNTACALYQINTEAYNVSHQDEKCACEQLEVNSDDLTAILKKKDVFPLLRFSGDIDNLKVELVESAPEIPYVAISHVWADGLGNPFANSLHRCRLHRLCQFMKAMPQPNQEAGHTASTLLVWLDTLCCPAIDDDKNGKQMAIAKLRLVYEKAKHVLVLDAGLMAYSAQPQDVSEQAVRIFTSSWMRRLWTLQEGALNSSLYFQFADGAVSFETLGTLIIKLQSSIRHRCMQVDTVKEFLGLATFFTPDATPELTRQTRLTRLDEALKYRTLSVPTDEPLCISTLMSLNLPDILAVKNKEDRMQKVWELLINKNGGVPAQVIFFQEERLSAQGWRWAPKSFLTINRGIYNVGNRKARWEDAQIAQIDPRGLRVQYSGWRISTVKSYDDNKPLNPFPGFSRISETAIQFRCKTTGNWYRIMSKDLAFESGIWTDEDRRAHSKLKLFPLHELANAQDSILVTNKKLRVPEGIFGYVTQEGEDGICVTTQMQVMVPGMQTDNGHIYDVVRRLAIELRSHKLTEQHLANYERLCNEHFQSSSEALSSQQKSELEGNEELKISIEALKAEMKERMGNAIAEDERLANAIKKFFGVSSLDSLWVLIYDFFWHDYEGEMIGDEQVWFID